MFPKNNAEWLNWVTQGKLLWADKEKIQALIDKQRTILADVDYLDLESVVKIVRNFENPQLPGEKILNRQGDGEYSDDELSLINDPWSELHPKSFVSNFWGAVQKLLRVQLKNFQGSNKLWRQGAAALGFSTWGEIRNMNMFKICLICKILVILQSNFSRRVG